MLRLWGPALAQVQQALAGTTTDRLAAAVADATRGRTDPPSPVPLPAAPVLHLPPGLGIDDRWPPAGGPPSADALPPADGLPAGDSFVLARPGAEPPATRDRPVTPRRLVAAEVAPGVYVTIDPALVGAPGEVLAHIRRALPRPGGADE